MHAVGNGKQSLIPAVVAAVASFAGLSSIFGYALWVHYRAIDWPYAGYAVVRIAAISVLVGAAAYLLGPRRSRVGALVFGVMAGIAGGVAYVYATTA